MKSDDVFTPNSTHLQVVEHPNIVEMLNFTALPL
jgi:hypothetical protein